jgi:CheY-like chemotaxis protein
MPGFDGLSIVEGLRANGWRHPIVVISAFVDGALIDEVARVPDVELLAKPFMPAELCATLGRVGVRLPRARFAAS